MSIIKFKAAPSWHFNAEIEEVVVERETDESVWIKGRRNAKQTSGGYCYFDSWGLAHAALLAARQDNVQIARRCLEVANSQLGNVKGMKPPKAD